MKIRVFETQYNDGETQLNKFMERSDISIIAIHTAAGGAGSDRHGSVFKHFVTVVYQYTDPKL